MVFVVEVFGFLFGVFEDGFVGFGQFVVDACALETEDFVVWQNLLRLAELVGVVGCENKLHII